MSMRASKVMGCTLRVVRLTSSTIPLLENFGMQISRTFCPWGPAHAPTPSLPLVSAKKTPAGEHTSPNTRAVEKAVPFVGPQTVSMPACAQQCI